MSPQWGGFQSVLADDIRNYLHHKRALGRKFKTEESALRLFDRYLDEQHVATTAAITLPLVEAFLATRPRRKARSYNHLLGVVRGFFSWLVIQERLQHSPVRIPPKRTAKQPQPFLFNPAQAKRLLNLAASLPDRPKGPNRGETYYVIFALMYALGLRVGEVSRLCHRDVDLHRQLLMICKTKFAKDRLTPFGPRVGRLLAGYLAHKQNRRSVIQPDEPVFSFNGGRPVHPCTISQTFHHLVSRHPFEIPPGVSPPRLHCLRHSFAVGTLLRWYRAGIDPGQRLIHLSTFLGHANPESTSWYLTVTAELLDEANRRFEQYATPVVQERV